MTTLRQETIVESKGGNALERMVDRVLHHAPPGGGEGVAAVDKQPIDGADAATIAATVASMGC